MRLALYEKVQGVWLCYKENHEFPEVSENLALVSNFISISVTIAKICGISHDWEKFEFLMDIRLQNIMKTVTYFLFYHNGVAYVPYQGVHTDESLPSEVPINLLEERFGFSISSKFQDFGEFSMHQSPDFLLFHCMDHVPWSGTSEALYGGFLIEKSEKWNHYCIPKMQFPSPEAIASAKGIFITGSEHHAYEITIDWIAELIKVIQETYAKNLRIVAICFGHQLLAQALGGKAGVNPDGKFVSKFENIKGKNQEELVIMQTHMDCALEIPPEAALLYTSDSCINEVFHIRDQVLGMQGHPEFTPALVRGLTEEFEIPSTQIPDNCDSIKTMENLKNFLKHGQLF